MKLSDLNKEQLAAATHDGNVFVLGNPGTGKTKLITGRVLHLLEKGVAPEDILCMTFTIKATDQLREKLNENLGKEHPEVNDVCVETFHSFSFNSVKPFLEQQGVKTNVLREGMQRFLLFKTIKKLDIFDYSDEYLVEIAADFSSKLSYLKSFGAKKNYSAKDIIAKLTELYGEKKVKPEEEKIKALVPYIPRILKEYDEEKAKHGIDYTDMLLFFKEQLNKEPMHFEHVIVDELQDANELQADIVLKLAEKGIYFVVGDRKQSIFRFQGASVNTFQRFKKKAKEFVLVKNYRSTDEILQYAKEYLIQKTDSYKDELKGLSSEKKGSKPAILSAEGDTSVVIHFIDKMLKKHGEVAIIALRHAQLREVADMLDLLGKEYTITGTRNSTSEYTKECITDLINVLLNKDKDSFLRVLASPFVNVSFRDVIELKEEMVEKDITDIEKLRGKPVLKGFFAMYDRFKESSATMYKSFGILFDQFLLPSALSLGKDQFLTTNGIYSSVREYFEEAVFTRHNDLIDYISISSEIYELVIGEEESKIKLFTVHSAKGKEFESVIYMPSKGGSGTKFIEWTFDGMILQDYDITEDLNFEEFKVDFVAMTRAMNELTVIGKPTYYLEGVSSKIDSTEIPNLETLNPETNTQLFNLYSHILPLLQECKYDSAITEINGLRKKRPIVLDWLLKYADDRRRANKSYSYSYFKSFLDCPRKFLFTQLLEVNAFEPSTGAMDFGTAVHDALETMSKKGTVSLDHIKDKKVRDAVANAFLCEAELLEKLKAETSKFVSAEGDYTVPLSEFLGKKCEGKIHGKVDKIFEANGKTVIVDYKTSAGGDADSNQLHLYRYLYSTEKKIKDIESILPYFYFVYVRDNPVKSESGRGHKIAGAQSAKYAEKLQEMRSAVEQIALGDPVVFLSKNEKGCDRCPAKLLCERLEWEKRGQSE
ncbi:ATP-dependent DNA helicase Rep [Candidatus Gugararchaeum adminiculabundum]|nr:ATP-dependent DNA helicase Rep [Candidatus Gugararchaeum adminiculabundum]